MHPSTHGPGLPKTGGRSAATPTGVLAPRAAVSSLLLLAACGPAGAETSNAPGSASSSDDAAVEVPSLPPALVGTFVPIGANAGGRVLIVSEDMLAAIGCAECGILTYVRLDQIACSSGDACEVEGEGCRGRLRREGEVLTVSMRGQGKGETAARCAGYEGEFLPGEMVGTAGQVLASREAPAGHVVIADIASPREVDLDGARRVADGRVTELDACYQAALIDAPTLSGTLVIEVVHGARGASKAPAHVRESSFEHPSLGGCLEAALHDLDYPLAADGLPAPVYYSLELVLR